MSNPTMYVVKCGVLYELRQIRFIGNPKHPHDVCAIAHSVEAMHLMADHIWNDIDYSRVHGDDHA